jgi:hypothetical protein
MISLDTVPSPNPEVVDRVMEDEAVLVHPVRGKVKVLNEVGATIWSAVDGVASAREIAGRICRHYTVEKDVAEKDTLEFLNALLERDLITVPER